MMWHFGAGGVYDVAFRSWRRNDVVAWDRRCLAERTAANKPLGLPGSGNV